MGGKSLYFSALNYGKESIALDLRRDEDRAIFEELIGRADVLVENFRRRARARWATAGPRCMRGGRRSSMPSSGFGHPGSCASDPRSTWSRQAMGGIVSLTGHPDGPPARVGVSIGDIAAGLFLATGITGALYRRRETGAGTMIDVAMLDCQLAILENALTTHLVTGAQPGRRHAPSEHRAVPGVHAPATESRSSSAPGTTICSPRSAPHRPIDLLVDVRFRSADDRRRNVDALEAEVQPALMTRPSAEWLERLERPVCRAHR